ncbi:50S ribosomal protein L9 [Vulgatibacter incomptus]|uniref:Large ribosomal subunit protein bL9 n=1 Tax=Vulgatibacter incomptus TaxID=1391653 RepID=A0A0K1PEJ0_9BACT|nr:50S ribosomal protein L9 [Vulgatibacter incomptus]AKU91930.1 LSU ribosomal protein L9p [Vulgatibacter incomptus]
MKIILRESVSNLGNAGDVVEVRPGYGRNFLIPKKKAVLATVGNIRRIEHEKRVALAHQAKLKAGATELAKRLAAVEITIARRVGEQDKLFGSVTAIDIAEKLEPMKLGIERRQIHLEEPIKTLGTFEIPVRLHHDVTQVIKVNVVAQE